MRNFYTYTNLTGYSDTKFITKTCLQLEEYK